MQLTKVGIASALDVAAGAVHLSTKLQTVNVPGADLHGKDAVDSPVIWKLRERERKKKR